MDALCAFTFPPPQTTTPSMSAYRRGLLQDRPPTPCVPSAPHSRSRSTSTASSTTSTSSTASPARKSSHRRTSSITTIAATRHLAAALSLVDAPPVPEIPVAYRNMSNNGAMSMAMQGRTRTSSLESFGTSSSGRSLAEAWWTLGRAERKPRNIRGAAVDAGDEDDDDDDDDEEFWGCRGLGDAGEKKRSGHGSMTPRQMRRWGVV